jgi:hypothetical protein
MFVTDEVQKAHLTEALAKRREELEAHVAMKAALSAPNAMDIGGVDGIGVGDVVPFRKRQQDPAPRGPRPPVQQPMRPAAGLELQKLVAKSKEPGSKLNKAELATLSAGAPGDFGRYLNAKLHERAPATMAVIAKRAVKR